MPGHTFLPGFGVRAMDAQKRTLDMNEGDLPSEWNSVMQEGLRAKIAVEDEVEKGLRAHVCPLALFSAQSLIDVLFILRLSK